MHYSRLLNVKQKPFTSSCDNPQLNPIEDDVNENSVNKIISIMKDYARNNSGVAPSHVENTNLDDNEINEVLSYLLYLQEKYFKDLPLSSELCKQFMWNIPKNVYKSFKECMEYGEPDILNPMMSLYIFCVDEPRFSVGKFIDTLYNLIGPDELDLIEEKVNEYNEYFNDNEEDDDEEDIPVVEMEEITDE